MAESIEQEVIVLEPSADESSDEFKIVSEVSETGKIEKSEESGEVVKNISTDESPERLLIEKMEELKTDVEVLQIPTLQEMFTAIVKLNFETVRTGLACDELLKMQSSKSQKVSIPGFNIWIPVKSSLLHGALRIAKIRKDISIYDFIIELIDMGSNTNLTDAENKTAFDIFVENFMAFDFKRFSLSDNNITFRLSLQVLKKLATKHCNQSSNSFQFYQTFMENGNSCFDSFSKEAELLYSESDFIPKSPFGDDLQMDDSVNVQDVLYFLKQPYDEALQQTLYCSYFYGKIDLNKKDEKDEDILMKLINQKVQLNDQTLQLLQSYNFDFRTTYKVDEKQMTIYGILTDRLMDAEIKNKKEGNSEKKVQMIKKHQLKQLKSMIPKMRGIVSESFTDNPDPNRQSLFNAEISNFEKYEEKAANDFIFDERIGKLENRIHKLENENRTVSKSENELKGQVKRMEGKMQNQENRIRTQDNRILNLERDLASLRRLIHSQPPSPNENAHPRQVTVSSPGGSLTPNRTSGSLTPNRVSGSLTPNRERGSLTPSRTVVKSPNQQKTKSPNTLMPSRPR